jgi:hypothetical protein
VLKLQKLPSVKPKLDRHAPKEAALQQSPGLRAGLFERPDRSVPCKQLAIQTSGHGTKYDDVTFPLRQKFGKGDARDRWHHSYYHSHFDSDRGTAELGL